MGLFKGLKRTQSGTRRRLGNTPTSAAVGLERLSAKVMTSTNSGLDVVCALAQTCAALQGYGPQRPADLQEVHQAPHQSPIQETTLRPSRPFRPTHVALATLVLTSGALLIACGGSSGEDIPQPKISAKSKPVLTIAGLQFKDLNGNGNLEPYENWRLSAEERAADLVSRMTLEEKAGMMLIDTLNAGTGGAVADPASEYIDKQLMSRFILRNVVTGTPAAGQVSPLEVTNFPAE